MLFHSSTHCPEGFLPPGQAPPDAAQFLPRLYETVPGLAPRPPFPHGTRTSSVPVTLANDGYIFVHRDNHSPPLTPPYEGPFKVLEHGDKTFVLYLGNRQDKVPVDRHKPAFLDLVKPVEPAKQPPRGHPVVPRFCYQTNEIWTSSQTPRKISERFHVTFS